jgi:hypothetical protein
VVAFLELLDLFLGAGLVGPKVDGRPFARRLGGHGGGKTDREYGGHEELVQVVGFTRSGPVGRLISRGFPVVEKAYEVGKESALRS